MATPNGTQFQVATDSGFTTKLIDYSGNYESSHNVASGVLTRGITLYARVRHSSAETGYSAWSPTRQFSITNYVRMVTSLTSYNDSHQGYCQFTSMAKDSAGNIYAVGGNGYISKFSPAGSKIWDKRIYYGSSDNYWGLQAIKIYDDVLYIVGYGYSTFNNIYISIFITMTTSGTISSFRTYGDDVLQTNAYNYNGVGARAPQLWDIILYNNAFYMCGYMSYYGSGGIYRTYPMMMKCNTDGTYVWCKSLSTANSNANCMQALGVNNNGEIISVGMYYTSAGSKAVCMKVDASGNVLYGKLHDIDANHTCYYYRMKMDSNNMAYIAGYYHDYSTGTGNNNVAMLIKWDTTNNTFVWKKQYHGSTGDDDRFFGVDIDSAGNIYASGYEYSTTNPAFGNPSTNSEAMITKWDNNGSLLWTRILSGSYQESFINVLTLNDSFLSLCSWEKSTSSGSAGKRLLSIIPTDVTSLPDNTTLPNISQLTWKVISMTVSTPPIVESATAFPSFDVWNLSYLATANKTANVSISDYTATVLYSTY